MFAIIPLTIFRTPSFLASYFFVSFSSLRFRSLSSSCCFLRVLFFSISSTILLFSSIFWSFFFFIFSVSTLTLCSLLRLSSFMRLTRSKALSSGSMELVFLGSDKCCSYTSSFPNWFKSCCRRSSIMASLLDTFEGDWGMRCRDFGCNFDESTEEAKSCG